MTEPARSWLRRTLEGCATISLVLMMSAKVSILFFVVLLLVAEIFVSKDLVRSIENLGAGLLAVAVGLYLIFCWFLPDHSAILKKAKAERAERHAALTQAMQRPEYWSNGSRITLACEREALLASLRAEGFQPGPVLTMANFLARKAVEKELKNHGFMFHDIIRIDGQSRRNAERAMFAARTDALIAEAKARLPNKLFRKNGHARA